MGYLIGYYYVNKDTVWKYNYKEKMHMLLIMVMVALPYVQLGANYGNISLLSMAAAAIIGFAFFFCDPNSDKYANYRIPAIIFIVSMISIAILIFFFRANPNLV
jgi:hypothetical protein